MRTPDLEGARDVEVLAGDIAAGFEESVEGVEGDEETAFALGGHFGDEDVRMVGWWPLGCGVSVGLSGR